MARLATALLLGAALAATAVDARKTSKKAIKVKRAAALDRPIPPSGGRPDGSDGTFNDKLSDRELKEHLRALVTQYDGDESRVAELLDTVLDDEEQTRDLLPIKSTEDKFDAKYLILGAGPGGASLLPPHSAPTKLCRAPVQPPKSLNRRGLCDCFATQASSWATTWSRISRTTLFSRRVRLLAPSTPTTRATAA